MRFILLLIFIGIWISFQLKIYFLPELVSMDVSSYMLFILLPSYPIIINTFVYLFYPHISVAFTSLISILIYITIFLILSKGYQHEALGLIVYLMIAALYSPVLTIQIIITIILCRRFNRLSLVNNRIITANTTG
jgi:hypothetical protein